MSWLKIDITSVKQLQHGDLFPAARSGMKAMCLSLHLMVPEGRCVMPNVLHSFVDRNCYC